MTLSKTSAYRLATCHADLRAVVEAVAAKMRVMVLCGYRNETDQAAAFANGFSNAKPGESPHNMRPAQAVDLAPLKFRPVTGDAYVDWDDVDLFDALARLVLTEAAKLGVDLVWGGTFKRVDRPHFQLASWRKPRRRAAP